MKKIRCKGKKCPNNCCLSFDGISERLTPVDAGIKFSDIVLSQSEANSIIEHGFKNLIVHTADGIYKLRTSSEGICQALVDGKCSIYECRPLVCKAYPFYIDMFAGLCTIDDCPVSPITDDITKYIDELKAVIEVYQKWILVYNKMIE